MKAAHDMIYDALLAVVQQRPVIELPDSPKSRSMALSTQDAEVCGVVNIKAEIDYYNYTAYTPIAQRVLCTASCLAYTLCYTASVHV